MQVHLKAEVTCILGDLLIPDSQNVVALWATDNQNVMALIKLGGYW